MERTQTEIRRGQRQSFCPARLPGRVDRQGFVLRAGCPNGPTMRGQGRGGVGLCQTNTYPKIHLCLNGVRTVLRHACEVRSTKNQTALPIGRTARMAFEIDALRAGCSKSAQLLLRQEEVDEVELEECARLDEALSRANRLLKS